MVDIINILLLNKILINLKKNNLSSLFHKDHEKKSITSLDHLNIIVRIAIKIIFFGRVILRGLMVEEVCAVFAFCGVFAFRKKFYNFLVNLKKFFVLKLIKKIILYLILSF